MANVLVNENSLSAIAAAIREKAGTQDTYRPGDMAQAILGIPGPEAAEPPKKDVNFYRYDGRRLFSYTREEIQAMSELPTYPDEDGITFVRWNWTLAQLKAHNGRMNVGAYCVASGNTSILTVEIPFDYEVCLYLQSASGGTIDWGDGTTESFPVANSYTNLQHSYAAGNYEIKITANNLKITFGGGDSSITTGKFANRHIADMFAYCRRAKWMVGGLNLTVTSALNDCGPSMVCWIMNPSATSLPAMKGMTACKTLCVSGNVTSVPTTTDAFQNVSALEEFYTPVLVTPPTFYYGNKAFGIRSLQDVYVPKNGAYSNNFCRGSAALRDLLIPEGITEIPSTAFMCTEASLMRVDFPSTLTSVDGTVYMNAQIVRFRSATPPTVVSSGMFGGANRMYVPAASLSAYQAATNLSEYADIMEGY